MNRKGWLTGMALLGVGATLFLSGCGETKPENQKEKTFRIGISVPSADHGWTGGVVWSAEYAKKKIEEANSDVKVLVSTAKDASEQIDKIENLMIQNIDALVVLPQEPGPLTSICETASKKGIRVIVVDRGLEKPVQDLLVAGDNAGFGRVAAEAMAKALDGKGNILIMEGIPCAVNNDRVNAFKAVMANHPGIKILESQSANWDMEKGLKLMENFLQKYPQIDAVWTGDDDVLIGALKAYEESGRKDVKLMIGGGGSKLIVKRVLDKDPVVRMTVTYPPMMVAVAAEKAVELCKKTAVIPENKTIVVPAEVVHSENAKDFYYPDSAY